MPGNSRDQVQVTAKTPGALPILGGRDGQTIVGYQVPQYNVGSPPATQAEIDAANAMADRISKAVGTTVDLVYPMTRMVHDGNLAPDYSAAPIGFRYDNGQSQYVNIDLNGQVTGVQKRTSGFAEVLPFIEKAVEFVFPATIPFIEGANALYAASQGNIVGALASAANMGVQIPGVDTSSFKSVTNYVNGANALAKGDIGGLVNAVGNATDDPSLKSDLKTAAQDLSIAQSVAGGNPMAALKSVMGSVDSGRGGVAETDDELAAEEARIDAEMKAKAAAANAAAAATQTGGGLDAAPEDTTAGGAGDDTIEGGLTRGLENATDLGTVDVNAPEAGWDAWTAPDSKTLAPVTVTGARGNNVITDSALPVNADVGTTSATELNPVTVTGARGNNVITDSALPVNADVGTNALSNVEVTGKRQIPSLDAVTVVGQTPYTPDQLPDLPDVSPLSAFASTEFSPVTVTGQRNPITDSGLFVDPNVGYHNPDAELAPVTVTGPRGNNTITDSSLPVNADVGSNALDQVTVSGNREGTDLTPVTVTGARELPAPLTVDDLAPLPYVTPLTSTITQPKVPTSVTPKTSTPTPETPSGGLPAYGDLAGIAGKVLTLGQMGKLMKYDEGLKQLNVPAEQRWADMQDMALQNADVNKALAALAQYAPDAEKDVLPSFYAHGGAVQHLAEGAQPDAAALSDAYARRDLMDALKNLGNIGSGMEPAKSRVFQLGQMGIPAQQKQLQQITVIPQLAALLQSRGMHLAGGGRADHEHPEYDGTPVFRTGGLEGLGGKYVEGKGDGTSDDITAMLANGEYVFSADVVSALGNGSNKAGAKELDHMVQAIRSRARSAPPDKLPPDAKSPLEYLKSSKGKKHG